MDDIIPDRKKPWPESHMDSAGLVYPEPGSMDSLNPGLGRVVGDESEASSNEAFEAYLVDIAERVVPTVLTEDTKESLRRVWRDAWNAGSDWTAAKIRELPLYWIETHPQLGGDVECDPTELRRALGL